MDWDNLRALCAQPSGRSWVLIGRAGRNLMRDEGVFGDSMRVLFCDMLRAVKKHWPPELCRRVDPDWGWPDLWRDIAQYMIRETDVYGYYEAGVCGHPHLRTNDGGQAVRLRRRFVGAAKSWSGDQAMKIGQKGEADLQGGVTLEFKTHRIECFVAVEVKTPDGSLSKEQKLYRDAVLRRGAIHVVATTVLEAVEGIKKAREEKLYQIAYG